MIDPPVRIPISTQRDFAAEWANELGSKWDSKHSGKRGGCVCQQSSENAWTGQRLAVAMPIKTRLSISSCAAFGIQPKQVK